MNWKQRTAVKTDEVACVASVSARVRRESWDKSKKKKKCDALTFAKSHNETHYGSRFRTITRLETLATQGTDEDGLN